jgi:spore maturation protein CgeB
VLDLQSGRTQVAFWDVDSPATLARIDANPDDHMRRLIPQFDFIFTYGGGIPVVEHYLRLGAGNCHPIYNALDPDTHHPVPPDGALACDLAFVGHRLPDRERRVAEFFLRAAELAPEMSFILGGEGWSDKRLPSNVRWIGHVATRDHNRVNCSARMVLNINRDSMAHTGFSPPTRVFEAGGVGACLITDRWPGVEMFFEPEGEILVAGSAEEVVAWLRRLDRQQTRAIGQAMRERALREHTYQLRAREVHRILQEHIAAEAVGASVQEQA